MKRLVSLVSMVLISGAMVVIGPPPAGATFPGANGDIAYLTPHGARAIRSDGSGDHRLTTAGKFGIFDVQYAPDGASVVFVEDSRHGSRIVQQDLATGDRTVILRRTDLPGHILWSVAMSPDGTSVVFCAERRAYHLYTMHTDGSGLAEVPSTNGYCYPDWGVDGRIVASKGVFAGDGNRVVTTMDPDGSNQQVIATFPPAKQAWNVIFILVPSWAPDGSAVAFTAQRHRINPDIWSVNANGSGLHKLTDTADVAEAGPVYSPDGTLMAFDRLDADFYGGDIWVMGADGSSPTQVTDRPRGEYATSWQAMPTPYPGPDAAGFAGSRGMPSGGRAARMGLMRGYPGIYVRLR